MKQYRDATIKVVLNGFIVIIGCQQVVAETPESLLKLIRNYLDDPEKTEKEMQEKSLQGGMEQCVPHMTLSLTTPSTHVRTCTEGDVTSAYSFGQGISE